MQEDAKKQSQDILQKQQELAKEVLFSSFLDNYQSYSNFIKKLPLQNHLKAIVIKHLDDSYLWTKEAFLSLNFDRPQVDIPKELKDAIKNGNVIDINHPDDAA